MTMWGISEGQGRDIVFVHGWGMDHRDEMRAYEPVFAGAPGWRRHYLDLPGMGNTPSSPAIHDLDDMLNVLLDGIEALTDGRRFLLAGTSAGAYLARGVVRRLSGRIDGLMLRAPLVVPDDASRDVDPVRPIIVSPELMVSISSSDAAALDGVLVQTPPHLEARLEQIRKSFEPAAASADQE